MDAAVSGTDSERKRLFAANAFADRDFACFLAGFHFLVGDDCFETGAELVGEVSQEVPLDLSVRV